MKVRTQTLAFENDPLQSALWLQVIVAIGFIHFRFADNVRV